MPTHTTRVVFALLVLFSSFINAHSNDDTVKSAQDIFKDIALEQLIENALIEFHTPGMSIAVVYRGEIVHLSGNGLANIEKQTPVDEHTYFRLASVSKAFTAAGLAVLVDRQLIAWSDKVIDILPGFHLQDPYATKNFTVKDLLTHRSGLVSGAGDSMIWPEPSGFTRDEVVYNLKYLTPDFAFSTQYAYSNVLYIAAGELIEKVSGIAFETFIDKEIFGALGMECFAGKMPETKLDNIAMSYAHNDERGQYSVPRNAITGASLMSAAAGGMVCNAHEMSKWLTALLTRQRLPFSSEQLDIMWRSQSIMGVSNQAFEWNGTHFRSYGLGWRLSNIEKYKFMSHTGTLSGYQAYLGLLPELELGVVILNNGSNYGARGAVMQSVIKGFMGDLSTNWIDKFKEHQAEQEQKWLKNNRTPEPNGPMILTDSSVIGDYKDTWFGKLHIFKQNDKLRIKSSRMKTLIGTLTPFQDNTFKVDWDNENAQREAFIHFDLDIEKNIVGAYLHPFSLNRRTNHAYRDMYFTPVIKASKW